MNNTENNIEIYQKDKIVTLEEIQNIKKFNIFFIFFSMKSCNPCQELERYIINLVNDKSIDKNVPIFKIMVNDIEKIEFAKICQKFNLHGSPTLLALYENNIFDRIDGLNMISSVDEIKQQLIKFFSVKEEQINNK